MENKNKTAALVYYSLCIAADLFILFMFIGMTLFGIGNMSDLWMILPLDLSGFLWLLISVVSFIKTTLNKANKTVRNSIWMKLTVMLLGLSVMSLFQSQSGSVFFVLFMITVMIGFVTVYQIKHPQTPSSPKSNQYPLPSRSKWSLDYAAKENMKLHENTDLSKVYDHTAVFFSYFFYWLAKSGYLNDEFYKDCRMDLIKDMLDRKITPITVFKNINYHFTDEYLTEDIVPFFSLYFDHIHLFTSTDIYLFDYYECCGDPKNSDCCIDFSWEVLDRLTEKIEMRFSDFAKENFHSNWEWYEDDEHIGMVRTQNFGNLEVFTARQKIKGSFPDHYEEQCTDTLNSLSPRQIEKLERFFDIYYGDTDDTRQLSIEDFNADYLYIMEPQIEGDVVFAVGGSAFFEEEHGISFTVRNGIIVDMGYSYDFSDPYSKENTKRFHTPDLDYCRIRSKKDAEALVSSGELVKAKIFSDIDCCRSENKDELLYLTKSGLSEIERCEQLIKDIMAYTGLTDLDLRYYVHYQTNPDDEKQSIIPRNIFIRSQNKKHNIQLSLTANIWY